MDGYKFFMPTQMEYGRGLARKTGELLKPYVKQKVLIVTDAGVRKAKILDPIEMSLNEQGIAYDIFDEVDPNPTNQIVENGLRYLQKGNCDIVLAVGGGSSIDTAKAIAALVNNSGSILDYEGVNKLPHPPLPIVAIPTTAGTGSEATPATIITNEKTLFKAAIISPHLYPKLAILDPELTLGLPPSITAATGMDALTHAIESYTSKFSNPVSQALAINAVKIIGENINKAYFVGTDMDSRGEMLVASCMAGMAFAQSRLGNVHAISHTLGGIFNIPHGIANAALLPYVMAYNLPACPDQYKEIAVALGEDVSGLPVTEAGRKAIEAIVTMNKSLNIPDNIKDLGVSLDYLPQMIRDTMRSGNVFANPRLTSESDVRQIIENAYHGVL
ncbi:iron-containing alcohol dehydrogenase [Caldalkalibacillus thermarum]|uniref:iron-containing alcohol dehydrogenase n=1 Tax=Caldalkalibacillus thermarum TaxID=296745 RepID=UPI00166D51B8|nr:iron-containing alcohol dehydrogenase [Caldalkalibacillus thermarum]